MKKREMTRKKKGNRVPGKHAATRQFRRSGTQSSQAEQGANVFAPCPADDD